MRPNEVPQIANDIQKLTQLVSITTHCWEWRLTVTCQWLKIFCRKATSLREANTAANGEPVMGRRQEAKEIYSFFNPPYS